MPKQGQFNKETLESGSAKIIYHTETQEFSRNKLPRAGSDSSEKKFWICKSTNRYYQERQKHLQHSLVQGTLLDPWATVICTGFPSVLSTLSSSHYSTTPTIPTQLFCFFCSCYWHFFAVLMAWDVPFLIVSLCVCAILKDWTI